MKIAVIKQTIALVEDETLIRGMDRKISVKFTFDQTTWNGFTKTVHFQAGSVLVSVPLENDTCDIPSECLEKAGVTLRVRVSGTNGSETVETPWCLISRILYDTDIDVPVPPGGYELPTATATRLGGVKIGYGLKFKADGTISIDTGNVVEEATAPEADVDAMIDDVFGE